MVKLDKHMSYGQLFIALFLVLMALFLYLTEIIDKVMAVAFMAAMWSGILVFLKFLISDLRLR